MIIIPPYITIKGMDAEKPEVFAGKDFISGDTIEICIVQLYSIEYKDILKKYLEWDKNNIAISYGYGMFYNKSNQPNAKIIKNDKNKEIRIVCTQKIKKGQIITI